MPVSLPKSKGFTLKSALLARFRRAELPDIGVQPQRGFTLIELLVVIAIIGILVTIIVATFGTTLQKSRDTRRKTDLDALKKALELHKSDSLGAAWYPNCGSGTSCTLPDRNAFNPSLKAAYIKDFPTDPSALHNYIYNVGVGFCGASGCSAYELIACLENPDDAQGITKPGSGPGSSCPTVKIYKISNP